MPGCAVEAWLGTYSDQYCSIWVKRVEVCAGSAGATFTARTIHSAGALAPDVEHVDAARRLLEAPEERPLAEQRMGENRAVHSAVRDDERRVPRRVSEQPLDGGQHTVEQLADRLTAEEALVVRDDAVERADELHFELGRRDGREPVARDLSELRPGLHFFAGRDEGRSLDGPRQVARDHPVERRPLEEGRGGRRLSTPLGGQRDIVGGDGPAVTVEVGNGTVAHQVDPATLHGR